MWLLNSSVPIFPTWALACKRRLTQPLLPSLYNTYSVVLEFLYRTRTKNCLEYHRNYFVPQSFAQNIQWNVITINTSLSALEVLLQPMHSRAYCINHFRLNQMRWGNSKKSNSTGMKYAHSSPFANFDTHARTLIEATKPNAFTMRTTCFHPPGPTF